MKIRSLFLALALLLTPAVTRAQTTIASSLELPFEESTGGVIGTSFGESFDAAQKFVTDDRAYSLTSLLVRLRIDAGNPVITGEIRAHDAIKDAPIGGPDGVLVSFADSVTPGADYADYAFAPLSALTLAPNAAYWVTLRSANGDAALWAFGSEDGPVSGPGAIPPRFAASPDSGANFQGRDGSPYLMRVSGLLNGAALPEPSALLLCAAALPLLLPSRRRQRQRAP